MHVFIHVQLVQCALTDRGYQMCDEGYTWSKETYMVIKVRIKANSYVIQAGTINVAWITIRFAKLIRVIDL